MNSSVYSKFSSKNFAVCNKLLATYLHILFHNIDLDAEEHICFDVVRFNCVHVVALKDYVCTRCCPRCGKHLYAFFAIGILVVGGQEHTSALYTPHLPRLKIVGQDNVLAQKLIWSQIWNKAALDNPVFAGAVIQVLDIELVALWVPLYAGYAWQRMLAAPQQAALQALEPSAS